MLTFEPLHTFAVVLLSDALGVGSTTTVVTAFVPFAHPVSFGVIVKVTVMAASELFVIVPFMVPGNDWLASAAYAVPPVAPALLELTPISYFRFAGIDGTVTDEMAMLTFEPLHTVGVVLFSDAFGVGSTITDVTAFVPFAQPESLGVMVKVTVMAASELFVSVPFIVPGNDWLASAA